MKASYNELRSIRRARGVEPETFTLRTRVPEKWRLVDLETGEVYVPASPSRDPGKQWLKVHGGRKK